eukprot:RCo034818
MARSRRRASGNEEQAEQAHRRSSAVLFLLSVTLSVAATAVNLPEALPLVVPRQPPHLTPQELSNLTLWWFAPFFSGGGYCSEAISFVSALSSLVPLRISHHGDLESWHFLRGLPQSTMEVLSRLASVRVDPDHSIMLCHSEPGAWSPSLYETAPCPLAGGQYLIGRTMFETDRVPSGWVERCNTIMDEIWVPTDFHYDTFSSSGVLPSKLVVIPEPIDTGFWSPVSVRGVAPMKLPSRKLDRRFQRESAKGSAGASAKSPKPKDCFAFLSVFKWEARKGWDVLLRAFVEEFDARRDHVCLYIKTSHFHSKENFAATVQDFTARHLGIASAQWNISVPSIEVLGDDIPQSEMPRLYSSVNAVVIPSRGEGWGRPHVEAMAMGLPLIATNWSGPTAFMTEENSYPLPIRGLVSVTSGPWYGHRWADPDPMLLRRLMREVYSDPERAKAKGKRAREDIVAKFGLEPVAQTVVQRLQHIRRKLHQRYLGEHSFAGHSFGEDGASPDLDELRRLEQEHYG